jgi:secondary thiamine-phosphate synthase enzyme
MLHQQTFTISTSGRGTIEISHRVDAIIRESGVRTGLCHVFEHHTSASLMLCENADPTVRDDLERFMSRIAPDGDPAYLHRSEGADDMPAHIRTVLTQTGLNIPVTDARSALGTWQGIYLWEHRHGGHRRRITVTVFGEP